MVSSHDALPYAASAKERYKNYIDQSQAQYQPKEVYIHVASAPAPKIKCRKLDMLASLAETYIIQEFQNESALGGSSEVAVTNDNKNTSVSVASLVL